MPWDYQVIEFDMNRDAKTIALKLNEEGRDGWELVGIMQPVPSVHGQWSYRMIMKREARVL